MKARTGSVVGLSALVVMFVGVGGVAAGDTRSRTVDCGRLGLPAAGPSTYRAWAKGVPCPFARSLLTSRAVANGLPGGTFVPPRLLRAKGFVCAYDPFTLVCWIGRVSGKKLGIDAYHLAAARSSRVVEAAPVGAEVTAPAYRAAAVKVVRMLAARQGYKTSAAVSAWKGGCGLSGDGFLPGVPTWQCTLFDSKRPSSCTDQVFVYHSGPGVRWEAVGPTSPVFCQ